MTHLRFVLIAIALLTSIRLSHSRAADANPLLILDMDTLRHRPTEVENAAKQKVPVGSAQLVDGKFGKAVQFSFIQSPGFMTASVPTTPDWDTSAGFSFYVKGDGSSSFGGIELIDRNNYSLRYGHCFPIDSTEWQKITVPWRDMIPELASPLIDPKTGYAPSSFGNFWFGKWFYWRDYPAHSYTIDQIALEKSIPPAPTPKSTGLTRLRAKLAQKKSITIVTMGDSLTDKRHWANRETVWCEILAKQIKEKYGSDVKLINPAIGGTTLSQNLILMPRWLKDAPHPDLVTIWFGFNDYDSGIRGQRFAEYLRLAVDRVRTMTGDSADVLLLTTNPAHSRWQTMQEMEQAGKTVANEKKTGLADIAAEFRKAGSPDEALKQTYFAWDKVHMGPKGHQLTAQTVLRTIQSD